MEQSLDFAFIKATEGSLYVDETYLNNRQNIEEYRPEGIFGFYHFFSFESSGYNQADNFIKNVGDLSGYLPPVVDIELYGKLKYDKPDKETVVDNLSQMLTALENEYGVKPIIYTTYLTYSEYIEGNFNDYPLWIRNVFTKPKMEWTFWQFTDKGKLLGYKGEEKFIDMNVFYGSLEELNTMLLP